MGVISLPRRSQFSVWSSTGIKTTNLFPDTDWIPYNTQFRIILYDPIRIHTTAVHNITRNHYLYLERYVFHFLTLFVYYIDYSISSFWYLEQPTPGPRNCISELKKANLKIFIQVLVGQIRLSFRTHGTQPFYIIYCSICLLSCSKKMRFHKKCRSFHQVAYAYFRAKYFFFLDDWTNGR